MKKAAIVLAGGVGSKLWPLSSERNPKQFMKLYGEATLLQNTFARLSGLYSSEEIFIVTFAGMEEHITSQLPGFPAANIISEPFGRNTAPAIALAAYHIAARRPDPDLVITAYPSDHIISNEREFYHACSLSIKAAEESDAIAVIGLTPNRPVNQYGYIQYSESPESVSHSLYSEGVRRTSTFAEKPDSETARRFIASGDFLWNTGIFSVKLPAFLASLGKHLPDIYNSLNNLKSSIGTVSYDDNLSFFYKQIPSVSIDYGLMEKASDILVIKGGFTWSDVGTWDELYRLSMKDARNNVLEGRAVAINTSNSLISARTKMVGVVDMDNVIVIESEDAVLVCKTGRSENVKEIIDMLRRQDINKQL